MIVDKNFPRAVTARGSSPELARPWNRDIHATQERYMRRLWTENRYNSQRSLATFARVPWEPFMIDGEVTESENDTSTPPVPPTLLDTYLVSTQAGESE